MKFSVIMLAFAQPESVRSVEVPDNELTGDFKP